MEVSPGTFGHLIASLLGQMYEPLKLVDVACSRLPERSWDPELKYGAQFIWIRLVLTLKRNARLPIYYKSTAVR